MRQMRNKFYRCAIAVCFAKFACSQPAVGDSISVSGVYEAYSSGTNGMLTNQQTGTFTANGLTNRYQVAYKWNISVAEQAKFEPYEVVTEATHVFNGVDTYCLRRSRSVNVALVQEGECPPIEQENLLVWLGFFSKQISDQKGESPVLNPLLIGVGLSSSDVRQISDYSPISHHPRRIQFISRGHHIATPYDKGYLAGEFRVLEETNVNSLTLPLVLEWKTYCAKTSGATTNDLLTTSAWRLQVTNISFNLPPPSPFPLDGGPITIQDRRFESEEGVALRYELTNRIWLPKGDPQLAAILASQVTPFHTASTNGNVLWKVIMFVMAAAIAAFVLSRNRIAKKYWFAGPP